MKTMILTLIKTIKNYVIINSKYWVILCIFVLAIILSNKNKAQEEVRVYAPKAFSHSYDPYWEKEVPTLFDNINHIEYKNVFSSSAGDVYHLNFVVKSGLENKLLIKATSTTGDEMTIGEVDLHVNNTDDFIEIPFIADGAYQNIWIEMSELDDKSSIFNVNGEMNRRGVFITNLGISRIDILPRDLHNLSPTFFGDTGWSEVLLENNINEVGGDLRKEKIKTKPTNLEGDFLAFLDIGIEEVDFDSKKNKHKVTIFKCNKDTKEDVLWSDEFSSYDMRKLYLRENVYRFEVMKKINKNDLYCLSISKAGKKNEFDDLSFAPITEKEDAFIAFTIFDYSEIDGEIKMLTKSKLEDLGKTFKYEYQNNNFVTDLFDLFEYSEDTKFDRDDKLVVSGEVEGNYFTYKFALNKVFKQFRIEAEQLDVDMDQIGISYSFNNNDWQEIGYIQEVDDPQKFDQVVNINDGSGEVFVKVFFKGEKNKKGRYYGLKKFRFSAIVQK